MKRTDVDLPPAVKLRLTLSALVGLAALPLLAEMEPQIAAFTAGALGLGVTISFLPLLTPGTWLLAALTLGGIANVLHAYDTLLGQGGVSLLLTMSALKTLEIRRERDLRVGFLLVLFLIVTAFLFDQALSTAVLLAVLLVLALALIIELTRGTGGSAWRQSLRLALLLTVQAIPLAVILFVLVPRIAAPLWQLELGTRAATTGMSDSLEIGSITRLTPSDEVAFRVHFEGPAPAANELYWRGPVLWQTDGRRWERATWGLQASPPALQKLDALVHYEVSLEPTAKRWLFALDLPLTAPTDATLTSDHQILADHPVTERRRYRLSSATRYVMTELFAEERLAALQVPSGVTPRLRELVASFAQPSAEPESVVEQALRFFREQPFYYSLAPPPLGEHAVDRFLFETRRGYCEHFASSFALLMRLAGIPARIVLGYLGGAHNTLSGHFLVLQSDAHAWTEVWLEGRGWTRVDPTAVIPPGRIESLATLGWLTREAPVRFRLMEMPGLGQRFGRGLSQIVEAINAGWHVWVLAYSKEHQGALLRSLGLDLVEHAGLLAGAVIGCGLFILGMSGLLQWHTTREPDPAQRLFTRFCRILARQGVARNPREGPLDYGRRAGRMRPELAPTIDRVIGSYLPLRYGGIREEDLLTRLRVGVRQLRRSAKAGPLGTHPRGTA